jgi:hypothetical protein
MNIHGGSSGYLNSYENSSILSFYPQTPQGGLYTFDLTL